MMEFRNAKLFIDGTEIPVENVQIGYDTASGPDQTMVSMVTGVAEWNVGAFRSFLELIGAFRSFLELMEAASSALKEELAIQSGRIVKVTGYRGDFAVYIIGRRKRKFGGGWAVVMTKTLVGKAVWLRSPSRPFRSIKSARRALERKGCGT